MVKDAILKGLKGYFTKGGKGNDALDVVLAIAIFKGIFRPTFTMMDKKEKPEVKKYAAFRECLTEAIAFLSYLTTAKLLKPLADPLCKKVMRTDLTEKVRGSISFISVCISAAVIIPAVCNLTLKPIMDLFKKYQDRKKAENNEKPDSENKLDIKENAVPEAAPVVVSFNLQNIAPNAKGNLVTLLSETALYHNAGMKVGG